MKRLKQITNIVTDLIEENVELKRQLELTEYSLTPEAEKDNRVINALVELGKQKVFSDCYRSYYDDLVYDENGINMTYEEWVKKVLSDPKAPNNLSLDDVMPIINDLAKKKYDEQVKYAQLEYARSKRDS